LSFSHAVGSRMSGRLQMATWMLMVLYFVWQLWLVNSLRYIEVGCVSSVNKISEPTGSCNR
jgi:preprotein translocase subunit SecG